VTEYNVLITRPARKDLESFPAKTQDRILGAIEDLRKNPRPRGCKKLQGRENAYRIRVGIYRVIYEIHGKDLLVLVVRIRHRKGAY